jgi:hypothetical protein
MHWWGDPARFGPWMDAGLNLIIYSADISAMQAKITTEVAALRKRAGDTPGGGGPADAI